MGIGPDPEVKQLFAFKGSHHVTRPRNNRLRNYVFFATVVVALVVGWWLVR